MYNRNKKLLATLAISFVVPLSCAYGQIVPDGKTLTDVNRNGNTATVTTATTKGANAFNSFKKFNVLDQDVVNLVLPESAENLINLIHEEGTYINGVLNSLKGGAVGGNVFLVNPNGVTVGAQGVVNVGSLTVVTPTSDYMNGFFLCHRRSQR